MIARAAVATLAAAAIALSVTAAHPQGLILQIEISGDNARPARPHGPVNTLQDFMVAMAACWSPPPLEANRRPLDLTFQVSFKRSGELFGKPRVVNFARPVTDEERQLYYTAVAEAVDRCAPMPFTESMGGAVAGRTLRVNLLDRRNSRKAEVSWLTMKTS